MFNTDRPAERRPSIGGSACRQDCAAGCDAASMNYANAQSNHSGGVNCLMGDGSVKFVKDSVAFASTWWALGTKANGETVGSDQY